MSGWEDDSMDYATHIRNRNAHSLAFFQQYEGKCVAWSEDGTEILAAADTWEELHQEVNRKDIKEYVGSFIPPLDQVWLGGALS